jgi:large subunit ribosomal protein L30
MSKKLKVKQIRSVIGRTQNQRDTLRGLGLRKLNQTVVRLDSPETRGMIKTVEHLVEWEEVENG